MLVSMRAFGMNVDNQARDDGRGAARYYDSIASQYDAYLSKPSSIRIRDQFRALVARRVPVGSCLLDFGCGTGLDARWYAARGYRVIAYDVAGEMIAGVRSSCAREIDAGSVIPWHAEYPRFLEELPVRYQPAAVVSNFAAVNHILDLRPLFATLARVLPPRSPVLAAVLNPFFIPDMTHRWWWGALLRGFPRRRVQFRGSSVNTFRHYPSVFRDAARPLFVPVPEDGRRGPTLLRQYLFMCFERAAADAETPC
jgi:SAM-dependent methyltransferase